MRLLLCTLFIGCGALQLPKSKAAVKIFCFAWHSNRTTEAGTLGDMKEMMSKCDGHAIFSKPNSNDPDLVEVKIPKQNTSSFFRSQRNHLNEKMGGYQFNMLYLMPCWNFLLTKGELDKYDWVINVEWDHFFRPTYVRKNIENDLAVLIEHGDNKQKEFGRDQKPLMLYWGNAFLFNKALTSEMRQKWGTLGQTVSAGLTTGCPKWDGPNSNRCPQDLSYPKMVKALQNMNTSVAAYGRAGCNQITPVGKAKLQLACYNLPSGEETKALAAVKAIKVGKRHMASTREGKEGKSLVVTDDFDTGMGDLDLSQVPIIHRVYYHSVQVYAKDQLGL